MVAGRLGSGAAGRSAAPNPVELARGDVVIVSDIEPGRDGLVEDVAQASGALSELSAFTLPFYKHFRDDPHAPAEDETL